MTDYDEVRRISETVRSVFDAFDAGIREVQRQLRVEDEDDNGTVGREWVVRSGPVYDASHEDVDPHLLDDLHNLGDKYGPLGVALTAASLTDDTVLTRELLERRVQQYRGPYPGRTPQLGHPVHYLSYGTPDGEYESTCRAAFVTAVDDDERWVSLAVLNPEGIFLKDTVSYEPHTEETGGTWHWPHTVKRSSKHEPQDA